AVEKPEPTLSSTLPPAASSAASPDSIILEAVSKLGGTLGRTGLAQFLTGSKAAWLEAFAQHSCYGRLATLSQQAIIDIIDALITDGRLTTTGGNRPKVVLGEQAKAEAESKEEGAVDEVIRREEFNGLAAEATRGVIVSTLALTEPDPALLEALHTWRTQQAKAQGMPPYIIFSNKVLEAIAAQRPATMAELGKISGIGPAKLERYGAAVIALIGQILDGNETQAMVREEKELLQPLVGVSQTRDWPDIFRDDLLESTSDDFTVQNPRPSERGSKTENPLEAILSVVSDLDGLLSPHGLASLLIAAPGEIVPFSDHELCGIFHRKLSLEAVETHIQEAIQAKHLALTPHQRLILVIGKR
ncbi:MAG TPA: HRDC domain-containing protein, partial [Anaerolineae bacterium]|nr:HRDC domain-containing protein [Anaerolineae bacterium]